MSTCFRLFSVGLFLIFVTPFLETSLLAGNFPEEAIASWKKRADRRVGAVKVVQADDKQLTVFVSPHGVLSERDLKDGKGIVRRVRNDRYAFQVNKSEGPYSLAGVRRPNDDKTGFEKILYGDLGLTLPDMYPLGTPILDLDNPSKFEKISQAFVADKIQLNLRCKMEQHDFLKNGDIVTLILDPAKEYLVQETRVEQPARKILYTIEYAYSEAFGHVASRMTFRFEFPGYPVETGETRIAPPEDAAIDAAEFRLPFYGFPEPDELRPKPWSIPFYVWALVVGVVAIGGASYMRYRNQRQV